MRKVNTWTRRSTRAWSGHSSTWRRRGRTSSSRYVCALIFKRLQGHRIGKWSSAYSGTSVTLPTSAFGTPCPLLWRFMVFQTRILPGVSWIGSPLLGLASSWDLHWCLGIPANSRVLLNPLPRQSTLPQLVVALSSFGSHTPWVILVRIIPMSHFNVTAPVHKRCKEPSVPFQNQAHRSEVSFSERECREREDSFYPCIHTWPTSWYFHQTPRSSNFHSFAGGSWCLFDFLSWCVGARL
jgi:hypothetical protein